MLNVSGPISMRSRRRQNEHISFPAYRSYNIFIILQILTLDVGESHIHNTYLIDLSNSYKQFEAIDLFFTSVYQVLKISENIF